MKSPLRFALNRMVAPGLSLPDFIPLAAALRRDGLGFQASALRRMRLADIQQALGASIAHLQKR
ncbi:hypothetical protein PSH59_11210 [Pseudomonas sp. FP2309]|nr:hypothetical protein [Pseudomonas sp. FP2309]WLH70642.1 hypothetical protein PSH59_11210 [Pseudomonas sp. FP2309]